MKKNQNINEPEIEFTQENLVPKGFNWFPGHMAKAVREIKDKLKSVDIVFEIRDARVPLTSGNPMLFSTLKQKSHLIIINKTNLASPSQIELWKKWYESKETPYIFINCFEKSEMKKVMNLARSIVQTKRRQSNPEGPLKTKMRLMILGLPNTGKSTIINQLANKNVAKVADLPGQTRAQQLIVIDRDLDLIDTPGVMPPHLNKESDGAMLSAINAIPDDIVGFEIPARFIVNYYKTNKTSAFFTNYKLQDMPNVHDLAIDELIDNIAKIRGCIKAGGLLNLERAYALIVNDFRKGDLGKACFEVPPN